MLWSQGNSSHKSSLHKAPWVSCLGKAWGCAPHLLIISLLVCTQGEQGLPGVSGDPGFQGDKVILSNTSSPTSTLILLVIVIFGLLS